MVPLFLRVYLSPDQDFSEVPLSPETLCRDILDLCQEPGETGCLLLQSWAQQERVVGEQENMFELLQSYSPHRDVRYSLRHMTDHMTSGGQGTEVDRAEHDEDGHVPTVSEQEMIRRLREKAQLHETKLQQIRAMRGAGESKRVRNIKSEELQQISTLFQMKQEELLVAAATMQRLTNQLQSIRNRRLDGHLKARLQRELQIRILNQGQGPGLVHHRDPELTERRLNQLRQKLRNKKNQQRHRENQVLSQGPHLTAGSRVAAVGPYLQFSSQTSESDLRPPPRPAKPTPVSKVPPPLPARTNHRDLTRKSPPPVPLRTNHNTDPQHQERQFDSNVAAVPPPLPRKSSGCSFRSSTLPLPKHRAPPSAAVRPLTPDQDQALPPALLRPQTVTGASIRSLYTGGGGGARYQPGHGTLPRSKPKAHSKPAGSASEAEFCFCGDLEPVPMATPREEEEVCQARPLSPTKLLPFLSGGLRAGLLNAPRPLKKRSSLCEPERGYFRTSLTSVTSLTSLTVLDQRNKPEDTEAAVDRRMVREDSHPDLIKAESPESVTPPPLPPRLPIADSAHRHLQAPPSPIEELDQSETSPQIDYASPKVLKSILRAPGSPGSDQTGAGLRVWFNPVCLLLDSALEGEFDLVQRVIYEVSDPSAANDEGITALHNAVCAGHTDIVNFLVQFGVNVNAADSDGWTPLHCAASCNNTEVCKLLVESGAAIFAWTHSDSQTPADKCEEQEQDYAQCSQFLYGVQEKMGVMNRGQVFALWSFEPEEPDEIQVSEGDCLTVLHRDQRSDALWWWVRGAQREGYIPRNLLGLYPRIKTRQRSLA